MIKRHAFIMHEGMRSGMLSHFFPLNNADLFYRQPQDLFHPWHGGSHPGDDFDPRGGAEKGDNSHLL